MFLLCKVEKNLFLKIIKCKLILGGETSLKIPDGDKNTVVR